MRNLRRKLKRRAAVLLAAVCILGFGTGVFGVFSAAVINGEKYEQRAEAQQFSDVTLRARRGTIYDRNKNVLAQSADVFRIYINPSEIKDAETGDKIARGVSRILGEDFEKLRAKCVRSKYKYAVLAKGVEYNKKQEILKFVKANKGYNRIIGTEADVKRYYPYSDFASTVLGFTGTDGFGLSGLEYYYDDVLTGTPGRLMTAKNASQVEMSADYASKYEALHGANLQLTVDQVIQYYLDSALEQAVKEFDATYGYGIVMDTQTGAVLAMSTKMDFDLNKPYEIKNEKVLEEIAKLKDEDEIKAAEAKARYDQWRNRNVSDSYEPGSVFKCITASACIEEGKVRMDEMFNCTGSITVRDRVYHCFKRDGHGPEDFKTSIMNSCNPIFVEVSRRLGPELFYKYFDAFGFTEPTGIDLPAEFKPKANLSFYTADRLRPVELASCSFGQSFQVSPIQVITAINAIGNGGKLMKPYIVEAALDENGNRTFETKPVLKRQVISAATAAKVTDAMEATVKYGPSKNGYVPGCRIAGKTGTSEKLPERKYYIGSFCGFAPADNPRITVLIAIDEPKTGVYYGGTVAAPVAAEVIEKTLHYLNVEPQYTEEELAKLDVKTPNMTGKSLKEAVRELQASGFELRCFGKGKTVSAQTPQAGQVVPKNGLVVLYSGNAGKERVKVPNLLGLSPGDANRAAVSAGVNIKLAGYSSGRNIVSYKQSIEAGTEIEAGSVVTLVFKSNENVRD